MASIARETQMESPEPIRLSECANEAVELSEWRRASPAGGRTRSTSRPRTLGASRWARSHDEYRNRALGYAKACRAQAAEDLKAAYRVGDSAPSTHCMLLQMVFENLAKAALLAGRQIDVAVATRSHVAASRLCATIRLNPSVAPEIATQEKMLQLVERIEALHPQLAQLVDSAAPRLEYPWEANGRVLWPAEHLEFSRTLCHPRRGSLPQLHAFAKDLHGWVLTARW